MGETKTITPELKTQCIQEGLDIKNAAAVARRHGSRNMLALIHFGMGLAKMAAIQVPVIG